MANNGLAGDYDGMSAARSLRALLLILLGIPGAAAGERVATITAPTMAHGKRCFEGVLGKFALDIAKSYAIHATRDVDSLGKKQSHGCLRSRPGAV